MKSNYYKLIVVSEYFIILIIILSLSINILYHIIYTCLIIIDNHQIVYFKDYILKCDLEWFCF